MCWLTVLWYEQLAKDEEKKKKEKAHLELELALLLLLELLLERVAVVAHLRQRRLQLLHPARYIRRTTIVSCRRAHSLLLDESESVQ